MYIYLSRVNQPITDHLPMTEHFGRSFSILLHLESFVYESLLKALQIIFENAKPSDQPKKSCKENTFFGIVKHIKKKNSSFRLLLLSNFITFLFLINSKQFKML